MTGCVIAVDRGRYTCLVAVGGARVPERTVTGDEGPRARPQGRSSSATGSAWSATPPAGRTPWPASSGSSERRVRAAAYRRRHRPGRAGHRRQRRPARRGHLARRPRAAPAADRPVPGGGVRRWAGPAARAHQGRPARSGRTSSPRYAPLQVPWVVTSTAGPAELHGLDALDEQLRRTACQRASSGTPGVGKSTLVNALVPGAARATGVVNETTGRGRHTSTSAVALRLPDAAGWVIDTPGVRSFGLAHVAPARIIDALPRPASPAPRSARAAAPTTSRSARSTTGSAAGRAGPAGRLAAGLAAPPPAGSIGRVR